MIVKHVCVAVMRYARGAVAGSALRLHGLARRWHQPAHGVQLLRPRVARHSCVVYASLMHCGGEGCIAFISRLRHRNANPGWAACTAAFHGKSQKNSRSEAWKHVGSDNRDVGTLWGCGLSHVRCRPVGQQGILDLMCMGEGWGACTFHTITKRRCCFAFCCVSWREPSRLQFGPPHKSTVAGSMQPRLLYAGRVSNAEQLRWSAALLLHAPCRTCCALCLRVCRAHGVASTDVGYGLHGVFLAGICSAAAAAVYRAAGVGVCCVTSLLRSSAVNSYACMKSMMLCI